MHKFLESAYTLYFANVCLADMLAISKTRDSTLQWRITKAQN